MPIDYTAVGGARLIYFKKLFKIVFQEGMWGLAVGACGQLSVKLGNKAEQELHQAVTGQVYQSVDKRTGDNLPELALNNSS